MSKKMLLVVLLLCGILAFAACGGGNGDDDVAPPQEDVVDQPPPQDDEPEEELAPPEEVEIGEREFYEFTWYFNYDWQTAFPWGEDTISAHWGEMFNIHVNTAAPDELATEVMNLMIIAGDLPCAIWMERDALNVEMTRMGLFYSIDELRGMVDNNWYNENVPASTQRHYEVDGVNHVIPNWVRMGVIGERGGATGGNDAWMMNVNAHAEVGSPTLATFEDLYEFAVAVRDAGLTNHAGADIIPVLFNGGQSMDSLTNAIFLSMGGMGPGWGGWYSIRPDGTHGSVWDDPVWRDAVMETNRWHREGLFPVTNMTNSRDQFLENLMNGRGALIWFDHSSDNDNNFRRILREQDPGNSIEVIYHRVDGHPYLFLPARGLPHDAIGHQTHGTLGWNGSFITRQAEQPGRIFELFTWMLTPLGSIEMMFGPQGYLWEELNAEGYPILITAPDDLSAEDHSAMGIWRWAFKGHANNVDNAKFAANAMLPEGTRNWVDYMQATLFTPNLRLTDEFQLFGIQIDSTSDLGIRRAMIEDHFEEMFPQIVLASTAEEAEALFDAVREFAYANGMYEIEEIYSARWEYNKAMQGGSIFSW